MMPNKTWDTIADFDAIYDIGLEPDGHPSTRPEIRGHYERRAIFNTNDPRLDFISPEWSKILTHFSWPTTHSIAIIGCGFGWSMEYLQSQGYEEVWGNDPSIYIQLTKADISSRDDIPNSLLSGRILANNLSSKAGRGMFVRNTIGRGQTFDVVVTERVLSSLTDAEAQSLSADLHNLTQTVIHIENDGFAEGLDGFTQHTLEEWKTLLPSDSIVESGGFRIVD